MEEAGVAKKFDTPVYQDSQGNDCQSEYATGCKAIHNLTHPEIYIVMDKVGGNTRQKGDGHIGVSYWFVKRGGCPTRSKYKR